VEADECAVRRVMMNLLANAARCAPESSEVRVRAGREGPGAVVRVVDAGERVPTEEAERIFEHGYDGMCSRGHHGLSIGLWIARGYVELLGGRIGVDATPTGDNAFYFTLPLAGEGYPPGTRRRRFSA
jgi:two-component system, OmpR family, sensor histidine kinase KdpD